MPKFADVFTEQKPSEKRPVTQKIKRIHYSKIMESVYQYRERQNDVVEALADLIKADGKVLEPCIVRKSGGDTYELIAGHKRRRACVYLAEQEGMEQFALIPCIEEDMTDVRAEFAVYSSNGYDEKTPYEIMREIEGMSRLLTEHPEEFPEFAGKGRLVEKLASQLQMSRSVVSDYKNISHNLGGKGMEAFKDGRLDKSAAVTLASMPEKDQDEIIEQGLTKREEIKGYMLEKNQAQEPSAEQIRHFAIYVKNILKETEEDNWAEALRHACKNAFGSGREPKYSYKGSYRGVSIGGLNEITWKRLVALIKECCPYIQGKQMTQQVVEPTQNDNGKEEQLAGQMNVADYPEVLPEQMKLEKVSNPQLGMEIFVEETQEKIERYLNELTQALSAKEWQQISALGRQIWIDADNIISVKNKFDM